MARGEGSARDCCKGKETGKSRRKCLGQIKSPVSLLLNRTFLVQEQMGRESTPWLTQRRWRCLK